MTRLFRAAAAAVLIALVVPGIAGATDESILFRAPYERSGSTVIGGTVLPCVDRSDFASQADPVAGTGGLDSVSVVRARDCASASWHAEDEWILGEVPEPLLGRPGTVWLVLDVDSASVEERGAAARQAELALSLGDRTWTLVAIACTSAEACVRVTPQEGRMVLKTSMDALPKTLTARVTRSSALTGGTGRARAELRGTLDAVVVRPAASV